MQYCSPEYIEEGKSGPEDDLWSLGLIIFYMLTGKHAFDGEDKEEICYKIMSGDFIDKKDIENFGDTEE